MARRKGLIANGKAPEWVVTCVGGSILVRGHAGVGAIGPWTVSAMPIRAHVAQSPAQRNSVQQLVFSQGPQVTAC